MFVDPVFDTSEGRQDYERGDETVGVSYIDPDDAAKAESFIDMVSNYYRSSKDVDENLEAVAAETAANPHEWQSSVDTWEPLTTATTMGLNTVPLEQAISQGQQATLPEAVHAAHAVSDALSRGDGKAK